MWKIEDEEFQTGNPIISGCNYHTTWQKDKGMRFVLTSIQGSQVLLRTRRTKKEFWTSKSSLIFITTTHNIKKAKEIIHRWNLKNCKDYGI